MLTTLRVWEHRYSEACIAGLRSRSGPGREPYLAPGQKAALRQLAVKGPDPAVHGVVRWRCVDLHAEVARSWSMEGHESTIGKWQDDLCLTRLQPRPVNPKKDGAAEQALRNFASLVDTALEGTTPCTPTELQFQDEARIGQQGSYDYIWAPVGSRPLMARDSRRNSASIVGATRAQRGIRAAMITLAPTLK